MSRRVEERQIAVRTHGRYLVEWAGGGGGGDDDNDNDKRPAGLLVGCHGYAENAEVHLEKLRRIPGAERWHLVAVQGLHRFYHPKTGDVLASWMTRQGREQAIEDNVRYLESVIAEVRRDLGADGRLVFAGFSQGVAMAYRAAAGSSFPCHGLLALAGDVPPDVAELAPSTLPPVLLGRGTEDEWYTAEKMEQDLAALDRLGVEFETCVFAGGHVWSPEFYRAAEGFLARIASDGS